MKISYNNRKLEKQLTDPTTLLKTFGRLAAKIQQRLSELEAAEHLADFKHIPAARCHELTGKRKGELAVVVSDNYRLIFIANHHPPPIKKDGGLNWHEVTMIKIIEIADYH